MFILANGVPKGPRAGDLSRLLTPISARPATEFASGEIEPLFTSRAPADTIGNRMCQNTIVLCKPDSHSMSGAVCLPAAFPQLLLQLLKVCAIRR